MTSKSRFSSATVIFRLIDQYEKSLKETLQKHAPSAPWYNEEIGKAKRKRRQFERRWRASRLCVDRQMYVEQCQVVNSMIKNAKTSYYSSAISNNAHNQRYPTASSTIELVNNFADFFSNKIAVLRNELANESIPGNQLNSVEQQTQSVEVTVFQTVTKQEVEHFIEVVGKHAKDSTIYAH